MEEATLAQYRTKQKEPEEAAAGCTDGGDGRRISLLPRNIPAEHLRLEPVNNDENTIASCEKRQIC
jgi:hypothetical protein